MYNKLMLILAQNYHDLLNNDPTRVNNTIPIYCIYVELNYEQIDKQRRAVVVVDRSTIFLATDSSITYNTPLNHGAEPSKVSLHVLPGRQPG